MEGERHDWSPADDAEITALQAMQPAHPEPPPFLFDAYACLGLDSRRPADHTLDDIDTAYAARLHDTGLPAALSRADRTAVMRRIARARDAYAQLTDTARRNRVDAQVSAALHDLAGRADVISDHAYAEYLRLIGAGQRPDVDALIAAATARVSINIDEELGTARGGSRQRQQRQQGGRRQFGLHAAPPGTDPLRGHPVRSAGRGDGRTGRGQEVAGQDEGRGRGGHTTLSRGGNSTSTSAVTTLSRRGAGAPKAASRK